MTDDRRRVEDLLGRSPRGAFSVVVRTPDGDPIVIANAPLLDDGTPMPTRYWLVGPAEMRAVGRLEAAGGVAAAEAEIDPAAIAEAHERYRIERDALIDPGHQGPRPSGGVGGTRTGVKCLHAHYAWFLAGGDDPVGRWVAERLTALSSPIEIDTASATVSDIGSDTGSGSAPPVERPTALWIGLGTDEITFSTGSNRSSGPQVATLATAVVAGLGLFDRDPPGPADLTNAIGIIDDALGDLGRHHPELALVETVVLTGPLARTIARVEIGADEVPAEIVISRAGVEEIFRTVATESRSDRVFNPGLPAEHVDSIVLAGCAAVAVLRHLDLGMITCHPGMTG